MSTVLEALAAQLTRPLDAEGGIAQGPYRYANVVGPTASPQIVVQRLNGITVRRGDALYFQSIAVNITPTAALNILGMSLTITDAASGFLGVIGSPVPTLINGITGAISVLFPPIPVVAFEDLALMGQITGANVNNQPLQVVLTTTFSVSTITTQWAIKVIHIKGVQDG